MMVTPAIIDTHQHNWQLSRFPYPWIKPDSVLGVDYLPEDGLALMEPDGVVGCVLVEAGAGAVGELDWFLELAYTHEHIRGVVGHVDLHADFAATLDQLNPDHRSYLKGIRRGIFDEAPNKALTSLLKALAQQGLTCDLLIGRDKLPLVEPIVRQHPQVTFVLDHFAGVAISGSNLTHYQAALQPIAALPNTVLKVSGYCTAADPQPLTATTLWPYLETALELFGTSRMMYGSDWPVCLRGGSYHETVSLLQTVTRNLSPHEQAELWNGTATRTYNL